MIGIEQWFPISLSIQVTLWVKKKKLQETSFAVQWLRLCTSSAGVSSIPGQGTKIPHAVDHDQKTKKKTQFWALLLITESKYLAGGVQGDPDVLT